MQCHSSHRLGDNIEEGQAQRKSQISSQVGQQAEELAGLYLSVGPDRVQEEDCRHCVRRGLLESGQDVEVHRGAAGEAVGRLGEPQLSVELGSLVTDTAVADTGGDVRDPGGKGDSFSS